MFHGHSSRSCTQIYAVILLQPQILTIIIIIDATVCRAEAATVALRGITTWTTWCGERWQRRTSRRWRSRQACSELMGSDLTVSHFCRGNKESASRWTSQWATQLSRTCKRRPRHQARQQRRQPKGKRTSIRHSLNHTCLFQLRHRQWEPLTRTAWTSWATLEGALHKAQMTTARASSSFSDSPF